MERGHRTAPRGECERGPWQQEGAGPEGRCPGPGGGGADAQQARRAAATGKAGHGQPVPRASGRVEDSGFRHQYPPGGGFVRGLGEAAGSPHRGAEGSGQPPPWTPQVPRSRLTSWTHTSPGLPTCGSGPPGTLSLTHGHTDANGTSVPSSSMWLPKRSKPQGQCSHPER